MIQLGTGGKLPDYSWRYGRYLRWEPGIAMYYQRGVSWPAYVVERDANGKATKVSCPNLIVSDSQSRHQTRTDDSPRSADTVSGLAKEPKHPHFHPDLGLK
jgi:hypothetical protein